MGFGDFMEDASDKISGAAEKVLSTIPGMEGVAEVLQNAGDAAFNYDGMFDGDGNPFKDNPNKRPRPDGTTPTFTKPATKPATNGGGGQSAANTGGGNNGNGCCGCSGKPERKKYTCEEKCAYGKMMKEKCATVRACAWKPRRRRYYRRRTPRRYTRGGYKWGNGRRLGTLWPQRPSRQMFNQMGQPYRTCGF